MVLNVKYVIQSINDFWFHESAVKSGTPIADTWDLCLRDREAFALYVAGLKLRINVAPTGK